MFDPAVRRHPVQTFQFWFIVLTCFVVVVCWKLDFFSVPHAPLPVVVSEEMPLPPLNSEPISEEIEDIAPVQGEEPAFVNALIASEQADAANSADQNADEVVAQENHSNANEIQLAKAEPNITRGKVEHADAEVINDNGKPSAVTAAKELNFEEADRLIAEGKDVAALRLISQWYWKHPTQRPQFINRLQVLSRRVYFAPTPHYLNPHIVTFGERREAIAQKYKITPEYLSKINHLDAKPLSAGQPLKVLRGPFAAVVDISDYEITIHSQGYFIAKFPVGFGSDMEIPAGSYRITEKQMNPHYNGPSGTIANTDPSNPLGAHWLSVNDATDAVQGLGIHAVKEPQFIGNSGGPGGIRMHPQDAAAVYDLLTQGAEIIIHK
ncbi:L,D-transpeptidase family protein [Planctomicrobium sp. SH668]|uniref:L,D-transpeptidase n=1 Tax=Planctomicrobium sp. SH668 TaxID=3448126 RepID=UPI003F5B7778